MLNCAHLKVIRVLSKRQKTLQLLLINILEKCGEKFQTTDSNFMVTEKSDCSIQFETFKQTKGIKHSSEKAPIQRIFGQRMTFHRWRNDEHSLSQLQVRSK
ncbi:hypothetical protein M9Y10_021647 [Tritrichomonas musculus]|uniref:Uncharacterized protein n=1 Tax=Tritrichomonas musculus TaxID=1915356 RepID=A0ABR2KQ32_9EUKA